MLRLLLFLLMLALPAQGGEVIVFHAGSLSVPFKKMEEEFKKAHPEIRVIRESSGSVRAIRKVVDLKKRCDVVASADYTLIPKFMFPKFADYVKVFATNELVLCYTGRSKFADEINSSNWFEILKRKGVKWGFSEPSLDPCGYRALMMVALAELHYKRPIFKELLGETTNLTLKREGSSLVVKVPPRLKLKGSKVFTRPKAVALLGLLETGAIDYAVEYKSVALQHGLRFIELPKELNLSDLNKEELYSRVRVILSNGKEVEGKPIAYGITRVKGAPHPKEAELWEEFVTSKEGARILKECWQNPIYPPKVIRAKNGEQ